MVELFVETHTLPPLPSTMSTSRITSAASTTRSQTRNPPWSKEEDALVTQAILSMETSISTLHTNTLLGITQVHPTPSASTSKTATAGTCLVRWAELATKLPGRTGKQIRDRWTNYLNPKIDRKPFTREEDEQLWHGQKVYGNKWVEISESVFEYKRSENQVKNRVCKNNVDAWIFVFSSEHFSSVVLVFQPQSYFSGTRQHSKLSSHPNTVGMPMKMPICSMNHQHHHRIGPRFEEQNMIRPRQNRRHLKSKTQL